MTGNTKTAKPTLPAASRAIFSLSSHVRLWPIVIVGLAADLASKSWAVNTLGSPENPKSIVIIQDYVNFSILFNPGAVIGMGAGKTGLLVSVTIAALFLLFFMFSVSRSSQKLYHVAMGMLIGGAAGNLYDRLFNNGHVVDFIKFDLHFWPANPWPTFNIADILLSVGAGIMLLSVLRHKEDFKPQTDKNTNSQ